MPWRLRWLAPALFSRHLPAGCFPTPLLVPLLWLPCLFPGHPPYLWFLYPVGRGLLLSFLRSPQQDLLALEFVLVFSHFHLNFLHSQQLGFLLLQEGPYADLRFLQLQ